jgi:DNA-directed RNA polymerase beta' subunit
VFPHDEKSDDEHACIESRGLLWNESFIEGLSPLAFFVHAIAGREALVEGATATAQSGYSMRLGVKALESTITEYDNHAIVHWNSCMLRTRFVKTGTSYSTFIMGLV